MQNGIRINLPPSMGDTFILSIDKTTKLINTNFSFPSHTSLQGPSKLRSAQG